jgi:hypothetical protein
MNIEQAKKQAEMGEAQRFIIVTDRRSEFFGETGTVRSVNKGWVLVNNMIGGGDLRRQVNMRASQIDIKNPIK